jgi:hypothetical protein
MFKHFLFLFVVLFVFQKVVELAVDFEFLELIEGTYFLELRI